MYYVIRFNGYFLTSAGKWSKKSKDATTFSTRDGAERRALSVPGATVEQR